MITLRVRTKDGMERLKVEATVTLAAVRELVSTQLGVPLEEQLISRSEQTGPVAKKGAAFSPADDSSQLATLGLGNGAMIFLDYQVARDNQAQYVETDPFKTLVKDGELRQQGKEQWRLSEFLDYRGTKEFVLEAPPEPRTKFVEVDPGASQMLMNFMIGSDFMCKRVGYLYGKWVEDAEGQLGVQVHAIFEPKQDSTAKDLVLVEDEDAEVRLGKLAAMLGLTRVGLIIGHPARDYAFSVNELLLASRMHAQAVQADAENGGRFIMMKARPVLDSETNIDGVATVEAYQVTDQCVELAVRDEPAFSQSKTDPRVAKTRADCTFVVEKKEQRKATVEHFVSRVFDIARPFQSFITSGFAIENRPTDPQTSERMASYLRARRSKGESFLLAISDLHLLLFLSNLLDMSTDMPILCSKVVARDTSDLDGFQMMINCYAGME